MRIGTWNLAGRWDVRHEQLILGQVCDVWLLTEVSERLSLKDYNQRNTEACMAPRRRWSAILSRKPIEVLPDPHPASALGRIQNLLFCSSILPWRSCGKTFPWIADKHAEKTRATLENLLEALPQSGLVWGGDWNHALSGSEYSGSKGGRAHLLNALESLQLKVPTAGLLHRLPGCLSIDHIAVGQSILVKSAERIDASKDGQRLSDHDAYVIETA